MNKNYLISILATILLFSATAKAELKAMDEISLGDTTAQAGITLSGQLDLKEGSSISYINEEAEHVNENGQVSTDKNWLVVDNIHGKVEFKNAKIDLENSYGPNNNGAIKLTLPESIEFKQFKVGGVYLGSSSQKTSAHRYLLGTNINGKLKMPTQPKAYMFIKP